MKVITNYNELPVEIIHSFLQYLEPKNLRNAELVCTLWYRIINASDNANLWRKICIAKKWFIPKNLVPTFNLKFLVFPLKGDLQIKTYGKIIVAEPEPLVEISIKKIPSSLLPTSLPFRFFINCEGLVKNREDEIHLFYENRYFVLTCRDSDEEEDYMKFLTKSIHHQLIFRNHSLPPDVRDLTIARAKTQNPPGIYISKELLSHEKKEGDGGELGHHGKNNEID